MKNFKIKSLILLLTSLAFSINSQTQKTEVTPSTYWEDYMSFKIGNYFEYEYNGGLYRYSRKIVGDTVVQSNGKRYYKIEYRSPLDSDPIYYYDRIDSIGDWYEYYGSLGECLVYRLNIPLNSSYMWRCSSVNSMTLLDTFSIGSMLGNTGPFLARKYHLNALAQQDEYVARKFQLYYLYNYEGGNYAHLVGAIIDSVVYGSISGISNENTEIPSQYKLYQNYPNPFNPKTFIKFQIPEYSFIRLAIYDLLGRELSLFYEDFIKPGEYKFEFDGSGLSSGVYFYKLQSKKYSKTLKMVLIK